MTEDQLDDAAEETARLLNEMMDRLSMQPITIEKARISSRIGHAMQGRVPGPKLDHPRREWVRLAKLKLARRISRFDPPRPV